MKGSKANNFQNEKIFTLMEFVSVLLVWTLELNIACFVHLRKGAGRKMVVLLYKEKKFCIQQSRESFGIKGNYKASTSSRLCLKGLTTSSKLAYGWYLKSGCRCPGSGVVGSEECADPSPFWAVANVSMNCVSDRFRTCWIRNPVLFSWRAGQSSVRWSSVSGSVLQMGQR